MRSRTLTAAATALTALLTLTACGGSDAPPPTSADDLKGIGAGTGKNGGSDGDGRAAGKGLGFKGLAKAGSMAGAARIVNGYTSCEQVSPKKDPDSDRDPDAEYDLKTYSVTERGYCGRRNVTGIFMIKDPKVFQAAFKAEVEKKGGSGNVNSGVVVGQDFAMGSESFSAMSAAIRPGSGMLMLNCHPDFNPPSGYVKEPALVKGCVLTNYYRD
jgi:hypothetical protein